MARRTGDPTGSPRCGGGVRYVDVHALEPPPSLLHDLRVGRSTPRPSSRTNSAAGTPAAPTPSPTSPRSSTSPDPPSTEPSHAPLGTQIALQDSYRLSLIHISEPTRLGM